MCGRYGRWSRRQRIEELLGIEPSGGDDFPDLYNITPGVNTWIVRAKNGTPTLWGAAGTGQDPRSRTLISSCGRGVAACVLETTDPGGDAVEGLLTGFYHHGSC